MLKQHSVLEIPLIKEKTLPGASPKKSDSETVEPMDNSSQVQTKTTISRELSIGSTVSVIDFLREAPKITLLDL